jgi:DNA ligase-1
MPDLGCIAELARRGKLDDGHISAKIPARFMIYPRGREFFPAAYLPKFPGLRVQVHKAEDGVRIFTSNLREISSSLNGLARDVGQLEADFVADADLIGFFDSVSGGASATSSICSRMEMLRYINRRRLARKSSIRPALLAYDLLLLDGRDICSMAYAGRRERMLGSLGPPQTVPFYGISPAEEWHLIERGDLDDHLCRAQREGASGLLARDPAGLYLPGEVAERDFIIRAEHTLSALVVAVEWTRRKNGEPHARYLVALRKGEALVPVGRVWRTRSDCDCRPLFQAAKSLQRSGDEAGAGAAPQILLKVKVQGVHKVGEEWRIIEPVIEGYHLRSSPEDADGIKRLESICSQ